MKLTPLHIGQIKLNPSVVNEQFVESAKTAVTDSAVKRGKSEVVEILENWSQDTALNLDGLEKLDDYASSVQSNYKRLEGSWWKNQKSKSVSVATKTKLEQKMASEGSVLLHHDRLVSELTEASARAAVTALAGSLSGAPGIVAAYAAYSNGTDWSGPETEQTGLVIKEVEALASGKSEMVTRNNSVQQVHREELWKSMNDLLDRSIAKAESGSAMELDLQYYELTSPELIDKIAMSAKAGNKVRVNLDAGRLSFPSRDAEGDNYFSLDATPDKLRTIIQLATLPAANIGISLFPQKKLLNSSTDLMHRKIMRVGDEVLVSGMNANLGSGENIDSGYIVKGDAAVALANNVARDIQDSKGATLDDIWGEAHIAKFQGSNIRLGQRGLISLLDTVSGPTPAGKPRPKVKTLAEFEALAKKAGVELSQIVEVPAKDYESAIAKVLNGRGEIQLSTKGKRLLKATIERAIEVTNSDKNLKRLDDMESPSAKKSGDIRVDIADSPVEREALVLAAIAQAEKFVYLPGFVVTRAVAASVAARRDQLKSEGKDLDVRVIADSGLYPSGGTPNSYGVKLLEDKGIQPRWAKLERSGNHDRKIHAKQLITEKGEITGSTNFSTKGLTQNWETSAFIHFDENNEQSVADREKSVAQFNGLWDNAFELNTTDHSAYLNRDRTTADKSWFIEDGRDRSVRHMLRLIGNYERESGKFHQSLLQERPDIQKKADSYQEQGYSYGDSTLKAIDEVLTPAEHSKLLSELKTNQTLNQLQARVMAFKHGEINAATGETFDLTEEILF